jgi:hypothetical protein
MLFPPELRSSLCFMGCETARLVSNGIFHQGDKVLTIKNCFNYELFLSSLRTCFTHLSNIAGTTQSKSIPGFPSSSDTCSRGVGWKQEAQRERPKVHKPQIQRRL